MDLLDRLLGHDAWTTRQLLGRCQQLTDRQLDRQFDIGHRTVRATLLHIIRNIEVWTDLMNGQLVAKDARIEDRTVAAMGLRLEGATAGFARASHAVARRNGWDELLLDTLDDPPAEKSYGGVVAHVITHSMHHRAQLLYMLHKLGIDGLPEGDVLSWEHEAG